MSYHDMTAGDIERDDALQGEFKPMELMVYSETWGKSKDYEQIVVTMHGFYNDMTNTSVLTGLYGNMMKRRTT